MPKAGRIPREVIEFFNQPGGHSLIVKGPAGTGKTTFALQLTEELQEVAASHYLSSRVSDESLYNQFPWLRDRLKPAVLQAVPPSTKVNTKVLRTALDQLEGKIELGEETGEDAGGNPSPARTSRTATSRCPSASTSPRSRRRTTSWTAASRSGPSS